MTPEQSAAYVNAQAACALAEMCSMEVANVERQMKGHMIAYDEKAFMDLQNKYCIGHNAVLEMFQQTY